MAERQEQALLGIAEAAEALIGIIDSGSYTLRYELQRAEWNHIASIARRALDPRTSPGSSPTCRCVSEGPRLIHADDCTWVTSSASSCEEV